MLTMNPHTYALAAYMQGALSAHATPSGAISGASLALITEEAIAYVNAYLVVTSQATIHATTFKAGYERTKQRLALSAQNTGFYVLRNHPTRTEHKAARNTARTQYRTEARPV